MKYSEIKSIKWSNAEKSTIDCILVTDIGELPFTANPNDPEEFGRELFKLIVETKQDSIEAYHEPEPEIPVLRQFSIPQTALKVNKL